MMLVLALCAALLVLSAEWHAYDHRRMTRPMGPDYGPAQEWAEDVEASLETDAEADTRPHRPLLGRLGTVNRDRDLESLIHSVSATWLDPKPKAPRKPRAVKYGPKAPRKARPRKARAPDLVNLT